MSVSWTFSAERHPAFVLTVDSVKCGYPVCGCFLITFFNDSINNVYL